MRTAKPVRAVVLIALAVLVALVAYAFVRGGREPVHEIVQTIAVPETAR